MTAELSKFDRRLADDRDWYGYLTLANFDAVAERFRSMIGDGQRYTFVAANEGFGYRPEVRVSEVAATVKTSRSDLDDGRAMAHLTIADRSHVWGLSTTLADDAKALATEPRYRTFLKFEYRKVTIDLYAPVGAHMWWVLGVEDPLDEASD